MPALFTYLPGPAELPTGDEVLERFLARVADAGLTLYPAQEEAILELFAGRHRVLSTPTGSGKSLVAMALHFKAMCEGQRSIYTAPIKALVNEKFFALCNDFGAEHVGMQTGGARGSTPTTRASPTATPGSIDGAGVVGPAGRLDGNEGEDEVRGTRRACLENQLVPRRGAERQPDGLRDAYVVNGDVTVFKGRAHGQAPSHPGHMKARVDKHVSIGETCEHIAVVTDGIDAIHRHLLLGIRKDVLQ